MRPDLVVIVVVGSELYGDSFGIVRDVSAERIAVEMVYMPPTGTEVTVHFHCIEDGERKCEMSLRASVQCCRYFGEWDRHRVVFMKILEYLQSSDADDHACVH